MATLDVGLLGGLTFGLAGSFFGATAGTDLQFNLDGVSTAELTEILIKLDDNAGRPGVYFRREAQTTGK